MVAVGIYVGMLESLTRNAARTDALRECRITTSAEKPAASVCFVYRSQLRLPSPGDEGEGEREWGEPIVFGTPLRSLARFVTCGTSVNEYAI